jgi:hypothetical protein
VDTHGRERQRPHLPLLPDMRVNGLLGGQGFPGYVAVAIGTFADPNFPEPTISVWADSRHLWVTLPPDMPSKRTPKQG